MKKYKYRFSLFTATHNRASKLKTLYDNILAQNFEGTFEWIIVSDGSTDNTDAVVSQFIGDEKIVIKYISQKWGGKHCAWRTASPLFEGQYVLTLDDDDPIPQDMLEIFDRHWKQLEKLPNYDAFWEIRGRCVDQNGRLVGKPLPSPYFDSDYNSMYYKYGNPCEMDGCRKVEILQTLGAVPDTFVYEEYCSNFSENIRWSRVARKYKTRFIPEITRCYLIGTDSYSFVKNKKRSTLQLFNDYVASLYMINEQRDLLLHYNSVKYIRLICKLIYRRLTLRKTCYHFLKCSCDKLLYLICFVPIFIFSKLKK